MDEISNSTFHHTKNKSQCAEDIPSLLTLVMDTTPQLWSELDKETKKKGQLIEALKSILVFLNTHLSFNSSNQVAIIAAHSFSIKYLYPPSNDLPTKTDGKEHPIITKNMYRGFRNVDETVVQELYKLLQEEAQQYPNNTSVKTTLSGAMSAGLTYINRIMKENEGNLFKSRLLVIKCGGNGQKDEIFQYIPIMNCIFSAIKMKCPIDVVKIGGISESTFLQQATDATNGVYLHVENTDGLIQYLSTAMFIDPSLRQWIVKPNHGSVDFRTSCYLTGKVVAVGFVCSVCLCVLSVIPTGNRCPACDSKFNEKVILKLKKKPVVCGTIKKKNRIAK